MLTPGAGAIGGGAHERPLIEIKTSVIRIHPTATRSVADMICASGEASGKSPLHDVKGSLQLTSRTPPRRTAQEFRSVSRASAFANISRDRKAGLPAEASAKSGGARRDRTDDLLLAKQALSQLSYGPVTR